MERYVVVTTEHRGVFAGLADEVVPEDSITLRDCRMCLYWPQTNKGVMGLAVDGPLDGARVTQAVSRILLRGVTSIMECSSAARQRWEAAPWK